MTYKTLENSHIYPHIKYIKQRNILKVTKSADVFQVSIDGFNLDIYALKMALSCRNKSE